MQNACLTTVDCPAFGQVPADEDAWLFWKKWKTEVNLGQCRPRRAHGAPGHVHLATSTNPDALHVTPSLRSKPWGYIVQHGIKPGTLE